MEMPTVNASTTRCPKCQAQRSDRAEECARCGIIFAKYRPGVEKARLSSSSPIFCEIEVAADGQAVAD